MREEIRKTVQVLEAGGVILYPTDTVWGIGCDATNKEAVKKVYDLKKREDAKALILLTDSMAKVQNFVCDVPDVAWDLVELSEKPVTVIYPKGKNLPASLLAEDGSIGIRVTEEEFSNALCRQFKRPIVSTSANISGEDSPLCFDEIDEKIRSQVDLVVDYRQDDTEKKTPSSIIKFEENGNFVMIRK